MRLLHCIESLLSLLIQVHSNSQALRALSSVIECLEKKLSSFLVSGVSSPVASGVPPGVSYAAAASSDSLGDSHHPPLTRFMFLQGLLPPLTIVHAMSLFSAYLKAGHLLSQTCWLMKYSSFFLGNTFQSRMCFVWGSMFNHLPPLICDLF